MLEILISWIFISITAYPLGLGLVKLVDRSLYGQSERDYDHTLVILMGLAVATAYAEYISLCAGVGLWAVVGLIALSVTVGVTCRRELCRQATNIRRILTGRCRLVGLLLIVIIVAFSTSRGYMHFDTNLYHAQAIRWIEEYGVVPGLANLQQRFGYNSAEFALNALYSFSWMLGRSLHTTAGYVVLIAAFEASRINIKRVSGYIRLGLIFYLCTILGEIVSPASDYYAQTMILLIFIKWIDALEDNEEKLLRTCLLSIIAVFAVTIKLSIALLVLLALVPAVQLIKERRTKGMYTCLCSGMLILIPYLARNVIISGWMLYPSVFPDIFKVDWKIPKEMVLYDAREIGVYGKGYTDISHYVDPVSSWAPHWFSNLAALEKLLVMASIISVLILILNIVVSIIQRGHTFLALESIVIIAGALFWFLSAPLIRYGYAYIIILPTLAGGILIKRFYRPWMDRIIYSIIVIFLLTRVWNMAGQMAGNIKLPYYIKQMDYEDMPATTYEVGGVTIYVGTDTGQIGYYKFPASPVVEDKLALRGDGLEDGFIRIN